MKICETYSHKCADLILKNKGLLFEIEESLTIDDLKITKGSTSKIKTAVRYKLDFYGWADKVKIGGAKIEINHMKDRIGICLQLGNVARMYADIMKMNYLYVEDVIDAGIICVPHRIESNLLGQNYTRFDRLKREVILFQKTINVPLFIYCLSN